MAGASDYAEPKLLDALFNNTNPSFGTTTFYMKLHIGDPGDAGTSNAATETTRKACTMGAASGGTIQNDAQVQWTNIAGSQDATYFSLWDDPTAGNCLATGTVTANPYTAGDTLTFATSSITVTLD